MRPAKEDHEKYHDCLINDIICLFCYDFKSKNDDMFCPHSRLRNLLDIPVVPICLKLGFLEQRAVALMHCYMSILIIRGHQSAMKGQVVHCQADIAENIGDLLPLPKCYEFMAVIQQKPTDDNGEIKCTVRYSVSAIQILRAIQYLIQNHSGYINKQVLALEKIEDMFECRKEQVAPIRIIDSYAYNNSTTSAPVILDDDEALFGPSRTLKAGDDPIWKIQPGMEECTFPWIYPTGEGGELDTKRSIPLKLRDYCKLRLMSADKRWQADPIWTFRAMNLIQRDDLCAAVNYHAKKLFKNDRLCYNIYPSIGKAVRGTAAFWCTPRKILRAMYATLSKPNIFLSVNLQDDVEFLTHIDRNRFGDVDNPNYDAIDSLSDDDYLQLVNENSGLVARMCHRRMLAFEKFISDKKHPFFIDYVVNNYFFKIEFQRGGLPHLHTLLWLDNFPSLDTSEGRKTIIEFIDKLLDATLPDKQIDPEGHLLDIHKNYLQENEIYEQIDPNNDPDLLQLAKEKKEFFERLKCRFGSPFELAKETHFRTYKEARILTRGDRDIVIKRLTEDSRRIVPYNLHFLKTFRCNHDIQIITDPWASAEYLFSYVSKNAHMEKNLVYQISNCTCSSLTEAKNVLLKTGNAVLSHRQVGKVEASWTVLGIPLYHSSIRSKTLYISLPWEEERILKRGRTQVTSVDDFVESLTHRYVKRPNTPSVIDQMTLFEFLTWFDFDRSPSMELQKILYEPVVVNPLWHTDFDQPPLLKNSAFLPRIILSCGSVLIQHKEPACISFNCRSDDSMLAIYSILSIGIPYRDPIEEFLGGKQALVRYEDNRKRIQHILKPLPFHIIVNGLAGSGKSYVISIIEQMLTDFCISESAVRNRPRRKKGLLKMAHTGKAALNILGWTIHTALGMRPDNTSTPNDAPSFKIHSLKNRLGDLILIIIDEISLVSHSLFQKVNKRLNQIFEVSDKSGVYFGNIPVLLFGDLAQCEPVAAKQIFWRAPGETFSLWSDLFRPINFNINMRQGDDRVFFDILCRMRLGEYNEQDEIAIKSRSIRKEDNPEHYQERLSELQSVDFSNAIYAYSVRSKTNERNSIKLKDTAVKLKKPIWIIQSIDKIGMVRTLFFNPVKASQKECKIILQPSDDENECGSMFEQLPLCIGARVICRRNIDFDGAMVNGTEATIKDITWDNSSHIVLPISNRCVFPNLDRAVTMTIPKYVELELNNGSIYKMIPEQVGFKDKNGIWMTRTQLPLSLGYAITVHRSQCMTYNKLVVDLTGINWKPGMFYTILSRTRKLTDIIILAYERKSFKVSKAALLEMARLHKLEEEFPIHIEQYLQSENYTDWCLSESLNIPKISPIPSYKVSLQTTSDCGDMKRLKCDISNLFKHSFLKNSQNIIICEKQDRNYCGRHCLRALAQNLDLFSDEYLVEIANNLAAAEQICRNGASIRITQYYYENSGDYDIQVLEAALRNIFNIQLLQINKLENSNCPIRSLILSNTQNIQALLIQQDYHYYILRQFRLTKGYFFKIDSKHPMYHESIHYQDILKFIDLLLQCNCNIYIAIQSISDDLNQDLSIDDIAKKLWVLPDAPADLEPLLLFSENEYKT
ncbi:unnamed protein product [Rotaria magnacalcarata]|uniref:ATP-dependent DNA helicase n=7 Tax=Rotaria magnacalcarata TaxID=392030 RepID=A0A816NXZ3_9BILA|nr:unnamed protein product [Rotaria magnacalcarata]